MPVQPIIIDPAILAAARRRRYYQVFWKPTWEDDWRDAIDTEDGTKVATKFIQVPAVHLAAGPTFSSATLGLRVGTMIRTDDTAPTRRTWAKLRGTFVKIVLLPFGALPGQNTVSETGASGFAVAGADQQDQDTVLFVGYVPEAVGAARRQFNQFSADQSADQMPTAYGLEFLLDRNVISTAWIRNKAYTRTSTSEGVIFEQNHEDDYAIRINSGIVFNDADRFGLSVTLPEEFDDAGQPKDRQRRGNRTKKPLTLSDVPLEPEEGDPTCHVFDGGPGDENDQVAAPGAEQWSAYDIAEYLLAAHGPGTVKDAAGNELPSSLNGLRWRLTLRRHDEWPNEPDPPTANVDDPDRKLYQALCKWKPAKVEAEGKTVKRIFDELFNATRGLGWRVRIAEGELDEDTQERGPDVAEVEIFSITEQPVTFGDELVLPASGRRHEFVLDGSLTTSSLQVSNDALTRYGKIVVQGAHILSCFTVSLNSTTLHPTWTVAEQAAYVNAAGNASADANDLVRASDVFRHVFTTFRMRPDWDGTVRVIGETGNPAGDLDPNGRWLANPDSNADGSLQTTAIAFNGSGRGIRNWGLRFTDWLPIRADESATEFDKELRRPLVLIQLTPTESGALRWAHVHREPGPGATVRMLDKSLGIEVNCQPNHLMALDAPIAGSDQPVSFTARPTNTQPAFDYRTLLATVAMRTDDRLRVEETIATGDPSLTLRITVDEAEAWYVVPQTVIDIKADSSLKYTAGGEVRNDRRRLQQVMSLCKTWYSTIRQRMTCTVSCIEPGYAVGDVLTKLVERTATRDFTTILNTPITSKVIDLEHQTTTWRTDFAELDVSMAAGR